MASNQYSYPPPPPPPPQHGPPAGFQPYQQPSYGQSPARGGGRGGRGGRGNYNQGGRGDFQAQSPYNHHAGGYNGPAPVGGGYVQQNPAPYIGPQAPPANGYPPPQWRGPDQQQQQPPHMQHQPHPPPPVPLSVQNYHPNYAPQVYQQPHNGLQQQPQPQQYGPQQPPYQAPPPQHPYPQGGPPPPHQAAPQPQQWQGQNQPHHMQPPFNNGGRGRGRGGNTSGRGGFEAPLMGPPIRMGFDSDRPPESMPQASHGFSQPYAPPQHSPPVPFSQPAYGNSPPFQNYAAPQNFSQRGRSSLDPNPFHSQGGRGRGAMNMRGNKRDHFGGGDKNRHRNAKPHFQNQNRAMNGSGHANDLPQKPAVDGAKTGENKKKKKKKRKTNTLGLTPRTEEYEDSEEEDDADEEARLAENAATFEIPQEPDDLAAWLAERRAKFPTKARREAKEAELAERRRAAAEQSARDRENARQDKEAQQATKTAESKLERQQRKAEKLRKQLEKAEKKVQEAKAGMKRKRDSGDVGDESDQEGGVKLDKDADMVDQVIAKATRGTAGDDSDSGSSDGSTEFTSTSDSDNDGPDAHTSRRTAPEKVPPPKKTILQRHCKYFSTGGTCGKKGKCRFIHDQSVRDAALKEKEANGGRMTLAQRLVQNDKEKDDLMVLKSIKYLYERGILDDPKLAEASAPAHQHQNGDGSFNGLPSGAMDEFKGTIL